MTDRGEILKDALNVINGERQDQYGDPEDSFALIAEYWTVYLRNKILNKSEDAGDVIFDERLVDLDDVAMMMTLFKIAREQYQGKRDNIVDAAGYLGIYGDKYKNTEHDQIIHHQTRKCKRCGDMTSFYPQSEDHIICDDCKQQGFNDNIMSKEEQAAKCEICKNYRSDLHYFKGALTCERCILLDCGVASPWEDLKWGSDSDAESKEQNIIPECPSCGAMFLNCCWSKEYQYYVCENCDPDL